MAKKPKKTPEREAGYYFSDSDLNRLHKLFGHLTEPTDPPRPNRQDRKNGYDPRLGFEAGASFHDIGKALGISRQAAYQVYEAAIKKIRQQILWKHDTYAQYLQELIDDGDFKISDTPRRRTRRR
jgi:hypothetical protein